MTSNTATGPGRTVQFTRMSEGTRDEYQYLSGLDASTSPNFPSA